MRYDYASIGFYTFDCLGWPFVAVPEGGGTAALEDFTLAVSGAAGTAAIAAARMGLRCLAVGGVGEDPMGDWVLQRLCHFGVDIAGMQRIAGGRTSSSIVTTRRDGSRPALHLRGATSAFHVDDDFIETTTDARVVHFGGVGLMDRMDTGRNAELARRARARGAITTVDVFAGSPADLPKLAGILPHTDYFTPSIEEAQALTGLTDIADMAKAFIDLGARCCIFNARCRGSLLASRRRDMVPPAGFRGRGQMHLRLRRCFQCRHGRCALPWHGPRRRCPLRAGDRRAQCHGPRLASRDRVLRTHAGLHAGHADALSRSERDVGGIAVARRTAAASGAAIS